MRLDAFTAMVMSATLSAVLGGCLAFVAATYPAGARRYLSEWCAAVLLGCVGWGLIALREQLPPLVGIPAANLAIVGSYLVFLRALRRFVGAAQRAMHDLGVLAATATILLLFLWLWPDLQLRIVLISALVAWICAQCIATLRGNHERPLPRSHRILIAVFGADIAFNVIRAAAELWAPAASFMGQPSNQTWLLMLIAIAPVSATLAFVLMVNDRLQHELTRLATTDPLTGIYNRRTVEAMAAQLLASSRHRRRPLGVMLVDADHFKRINDTLGHAAGDSALRTLAGALRTNARDGDVLGRIGGEEFALVLPDTDVRGAAAVAERIRSAVEHCEFAPSGTRWPLHVSIGVAEAAPADSDFGAALNRADRALYRAKEAGRNRVAVLPADEAEPVAGAAVADR